MCDTPSDVPEINLNHSVSFPKTQEEQVILVASSLKKIQNVHKQKQCPFRELRVFRSAVFHATLYFIERGANYSSNILISLNNLRKYSLQISFRL